MLVATRRARRLFHSLFLAPRMGDTTSKIVSPQEAFPGRKEAILVAAKHHVSGNRTVEPFPEGTQMAVFGMGCFWGAERKFWTLKGVYSTQVGFAGGYTPNPTYKEVCSGKTGHAEVVRVVYQPERISFEELLKVFWENHDPTQGMRQGNDYGSQYRSAIYPTSADHMEAALRSKEDYQKGAGWEKRIPTSSLFGKGSFRARLWPDHDRHPGGTNFLLRRGLPPAVPEQEPRRVLRPRGHRSVLSTGY
ncbi:mitochondrial peptide methionine sulfoxide reductase isoform X1 [Equus quagga]|uniref:mitochondrial peptide methionine sulfoxide reductase isoform X1 n=1 Tax=Equus quagga TaxID=89248 RepID=UPI001EE1AB3B|nr:mitochondrial peptide methionine sulfoxide reductase isoform X1 [Equus quagga]